MPIYDLACDKCELIEEVVCRIADREAQPCPDCGEPMRMHIGPSVGVVIGATFSKPIEITGAGKFETNAEFRAWQKENPNAHVVPKNDARVVNMKDKARNAAEKTAKKQGWSDHGEKVRKNKESIAAGTGYVPSPNAS